MPTEWNRHAPRVDDGQTKQILAFDTRASAQPYFVVTCTGHRRFTDYSVPGRWGPSEYWSFNWVWAELPTPPK